MAPAPGYKRVEYGELGEYIGSDVRFTTRTPAGRLFLHKGVLNTEPVSGHPELKYALMYPEHPGQGIYIKPDDTVHIKLRR